MRFAILFYFSALMGCSVLDGYEFGDGTKVTMGLRTVYCNTLPEKVRRAALRRMQKEVEGYPRHSICDAEGFIIDVVKPK